MTDPTLAVPPDDHDEEAETTSASELEAFEKELLAQKDRYLRLAAEYDNFRRRAVKERHEAGYRRSTA